MNPNSKKIGWCDWTSNPTPGCMHGCFYCYAKGMCERMGRSFEPSVHLERIKQWRKAKPGDRIFVGSSGDMWGYWVSLRNIAVVLDEMKKYPELIFQTLTKNPKRYAEFILPSNLWIGTTLTSQQDIWRLNDFPRNEQIKFISAEPLLDNLKLDALLADFDWLIIGGMTGRYASQYPCPDERVESLIAQADKYHVPVYVKDTHYKQFPRREFPKVS